MLLHLLYKWIIAVFYCISTDLAYSAQQLKHASPLPGMYARKVVRDFLHFMHWTVWGEVNWSFSMVFVFSARPLKYDGLIVRTIDSN